MNRRTVRAAGPMVYAIAMMVAIFVSAGAVGAVAVIGAMLLGLMYTVTRPELSDDYDRSAARAARAERRAAR